MAWTGHAEWRQTTADDESVAAGAGAGAGAASGASGASGGVAAHGVLQLHHAHTLFIGDSARLGLTKSSYTVEAWVKLSKYNTTGGQHDQTILASDTLHVGSCLHVIIRDGHPYLGHYCHDTSTGYRVPLHRWVHLAFVYDADSREQIVYADGERIGGEAGRPPLDRGVPLHIGRYAGACACLVIGLRARLCVCVCVRVADGGWCSCVGMYSLFAGGRPLLGDMSELRVWRCARSAKDIAASMHDHIRSFDGHPELAVCWALRSSRLSNGSVMAWTGHAEWKEPHCDTPDEHKATDAEPAATSDAAAGDKPDVADLVASLRNADSSTAVAAALADIQDAFTRGVRPVKARIVEACNTARERVGAQAWTTVAPLVGRVLRLLYS